MWRIFILLVLAAAVYASYRQAQPQPTNEVVSNLSAVPRGDSTAVFRQPPRNHTQTGGTIVQGTFGYEYLLFLPKGYGNPKLRWPMIVYLHGVTMGNNVNNSKNYGVIKYAIEHEDFPFMVCAPATKAGWSIATLQGMVTSLPYPGVDRDRIYLTGYSMGGHALWKWVLESPHTFAAIAPLAGAGDARTAAKKLGHMPCWIFHGLMDDVVPASHAFQMIGALRSAKAEVRYTIPSDKGHDILGVAYDSPDLYDWFLLHERTFAKNKQKQKTEAHPVASPVSN